MKKIIKIIGAERESYWYANRLGSIWVVEWVSGMNQWRTTESVNEHGAGFIVFSDARVIRGFRCTECGKLSTVAELADPNYVLLDDGTAWRRLMCLCGRICRARPIYDLIGEPAKNMVI